MNFIKSFLRIISAYLIVLALMTALADKFTKYSFENEILDNIYHFIIVAALFFILVFLSTYFALPPKKWGAVLSTIVSYLFAVFMMYRHLGVSHQSLSYTMVASQSGLTAGVVLGILCGHKLLRNKGWNKPKPTESELSNY
jgi:peptidoglycan/LPS O-acetylase OafA/YrhL